MVQGASFQWEGGLLLKRTPDGGGRGCRDPETHRYAEAYGQTDSYPKTDCQTDSQTDGYPKTDCHSKTDGYADAHIENYLISRVYKDLRFMFGSYWNNRITVVRRDCDSGRI